MHVPIRITPTSLRRTGRAPLDAIQLYGTTQRRVVNSAPLARLVKPNLPGRVANRRNACSHPYSDELASVFRDDAVDVNNGKSGIRHPTARSTIAYRSESARPAKQTELCDCTRVGRVAV